ncbi:Dihydroorotate dehydrogenase (quinone) [hydrothermal vent metagenome]|uniref:Dihydroorotate dehydrogenase (Quinone) n=1 Tax=hydrothermal vent metagenome TaxID=652676 RepID=A0A3B0TXY1_9ZZZZ
MRMTYRLDETYDWNYANGPAYDGPFPPVPNTPQKDFFGIPVNSRLGIAAGLLLNSRWIDTYARLGFDILTYKTVRSRHRDCYDLPNWIFIDTEGQIDPTELSQSQVRKADEPETLTTATSSVSFGMPSRAPREWMPDVARAREALGDGQALIVSVVASPEPGADVAEMIDDYGALAAMAGEAGAQIVEANLSCPNVCTAEGDVFLDAELSGKIARAMHDNAGGRPVLLKLGYFADPARLEAVLKAVDGAASGVVMVNGISRNIIEPDGSAAFGPGREKAGLLGRGIHTFSVDNVQKALAVVAKHKLALKVVAVGGVSTPEDATPYFDAGAAAVMMGSAPMFDPTLAIRIKQSHPEW